MSCCARIKRDDPDHSVAVEALIGLRERGHDPAIVPQIVYEFYVVATRPIPQNGLGIAPDSVIDDLNELIARVIVLNDAPRLLVIWKSLVRRYGVRGKPAHDARLVAAMRTHGVSHLVTFNSSDFNRYQDEIQLLAPHRIEL